MFLHSVSGCQRTPLQLHRDRRRNAPAEFHVRVRVVGSIRADIGWLNTAIVKDAARR